MEGSCQLRSAGHVLASLLLATDSPYPVRLELEFVWRENASSGESQWEFGEEMALTIDEPPLLPSGPAAWSPAPEGLNVEIRFASDYESIEQRLRAVGLRLAPYVEDGRAPTENGR
jgi:hypothetical protein